MILLASCLESAATLTLEQLMGCLGVEAFGNYVFATLVFFLVIGFVMWKHGITIYAGIPLGIALVYVLMQASGIPVFSTLMTLSMIAAAVLFFLAFWHIFAERLR